MDKATRIVACGKSRGAERDTNKRTKSLGGGSDAISHKGSARGGLTNGIKGREDV